jgi:Fe2+ or Zn2+ uptake regulation protein
MNLLSNFSNTLRSNGFRLTHQRQMVLDVLTNTNEHLDAEMIHDRLKTTEPRISLATVYRTLALLKDFGLVQEQALGEEHGHYEIAKELPHYHFTCQKCGRVIEFEAEAVNQVVQSLVKQEQIQVSSIHFSVDGYCATCHKKLPEITP